MTFILEHIPVTLVVIVAVIFAFKVASAIFPGMEE